MSLMQDIATVIGNRFTAVIQRLNNTSKVVKKGFWTSTATIILYDDARIRLYYDGTDNYLKVVNKVNSGVGLFGRMVKGTTQIVFNTTIPPAAGTYHLTNNLNPSINYNFVGLSNFDFRIEIPDSDMVLFGHTARSGANISTTCYIQNAGFIA